MKLKYEEPPKMGAKRLLQIDQANTIIADYADQGLTLTLRQLYYQFVSKGWIENTDRSYKNLGSTINVGRMGGMIDWNAIVDRTRTLRGNQHWSNPADLIDAAAASFRYDLWRDQPTRVEVWIEKDALVGVIDQVCRRLDVDFFSCRGYVSSSSMWQAAQRIGRSLRADQNVVILHLGDHDPSGMQMTEDIQARLSQFCLVDAVRDAKRAYGTMVEHEEAMLLRSNQGLLSPTVERIALTMDQIRELNPPPNPAKMSDTRAGDYVERYGRSSWELDALEPTYLRDLISESVAEHRDELLWDRAVERQTAARDRLQIAAENIREELEAEDDE